MKRWITICFVLFLFLFLVSFTLTPQTFALILKKPEKVRKNERLSATTCHIWSIRHLTKNMRRALKLNGFKALTLGRGRRIRTLNKGFGVLTYQLLHALIHKDQSLLLLNKCRQFEGHQTIDALITQQIIT